MNELNLKRKEKNYFYSSWVSILILMVLCFFFAKGAMEIALKERASSQRLSQIRGEVKMLDEREAYIRGNLNLLATEQGVEMEIREKFGALREGEYLALVVEPQNTSTTSEEVSQSWFNRLWSVIIRDK